MSPNTPRAYSYLRVSTLHQEQSGYSLGAQEADNREYARRQGYDLIATYTDSESGAGFDRRDLSQVIQDAQAQLFDVLIIAELDRLTRAELRQFLNFEHQLQQAGITIEYARQPFLNQPDSAFQKNILAVVAHEERSRTRRRTMTGRRKKVEAGKWLGSGEPPYGFERDGYGPESTLTIHPERAEIVRRIFRWYALENVPVFRIAERLTRQRIPNPGDVTAGDYPNRKRKFGHWFPGQIYRMLNTRAYMGELRLYKTRRVNGKRVDVPEEDQLTIPCPAIISPDLFFKAKQRRARGQAMASRNTKHKYLLGRRIRCACGFAVSGRAASADRKYYRCISYNRDARVEASNCGLGYFRASKVDQAVWSWVQDIIEDPQHLRTGYQHMTDQLTADHARFAAQIAEVDAAVAEATARQDRLVELYEHAVIDMDAVDRRAADIHQELDRLRSRRAHLQSQIEVPVPTPEFLENFETFAATIRDKLPLVNFNQKRQIIDELDITVVLERSGDERLIHAKSNLLGFNHTQTLKI